MAQPWKATVGPLAAAAANNIAASQSPGAGVIALNGTVGTGNLDAARRIIVTSGGNDSGVTFTIAGKNRGGAAQTETIAGANAGAASSTQDFLSVSSVTHTGSVAGTVTVGTNGVASSPVFLTNWSTSPMNFGLAGLVSGTVSYTVEYTMEDPNNPAGAFPTWFPLAALATKTANTDSSLTTPVAAIRLTVNSNTNPATATLVILQAGLGFGN